MTKIALIAFSAAAVLGLSACAEEPAEDVTVIETEAAEPVDAMAADTAAVDAAADAAADATAEATEEVVAEEAAEPAM